MEKKNKKVLSIIASVILVVICIGATYAYFVAQTGDNKSVDINVTANTVDVFSFEVGDPVSININQDNFASGTNSMSSTTYAKALLTANNKTNTATRNYYLYLNITNNTLTYSLNTSTPEVLLTITDGSGTEITLLTGLDYKTVTDAKGVSVSGFDITTKSGLITILDNRSITTTSTKEETWNVKMTFINHTHNQAANAGKSITAKLLIQKDEYVSTLADYVKSQYTGIQGENGIYLHNSSLANGAGDNSYRYAGANPNNYVCFGTDAESCPNDNLYRIIGVFGSQVKLIKYDYATSAQLGEIGDYYGAYSYGSDTYKGSNYSNIAAYYWNKVNYNAAYNATSKYNVWSYSQLNTINLNTNYITYLNNQNSKWSNMIAETTWKVGGNTWANIGTSAMNIAHQNEIVNPSTDLSEQYRTHPAKIGLMYVSDYGYAASPSAWTTTLNKYDSSSVASENWMYMGLYEWTISRRSDGSYSAFRVYSDGRLHNNNVDISRAVRPVFYLNSNVTYSSGDGSSSNPIRVN